MATVYYTVRATHRDARGDTRTFKHGDRHVDKDAAYEVLTAVLNALEDAGVSASGEVHVTGSDEMVVRL